MRARLVLLAAACALLLTGPGLAGDDHATPAEAEAMVKKAVSFIRANGTEKAYAEIDNREGQFVDRELYIVVYAADGTCLAHGANIKLVGKNLASMQDVDGRYYVRERMDLASWKETFWHSYKFANPTTRKIEPKQTYCVRLDGTVVCCGIYTPS